MKKVILFLAVIAIVSAIGVNYVSTSATRDVSEIELANIEALAGDENNSNDCNYRNGYVAFTNKEGGAYDCCKVWVSYAPNTSEGHCR